jgi:hypothetical protein
MVYKLSDGVIGRIAQIIQEGMLMGVDVVDLMRQIEVEHAHNDNGPNFLELTSEYSRRVNEHYEKMLAEAEELQAQRSLSEGPVFSDS